MNKKTLTTKYIFITGGVSSSLGKGILAASLGKLLQSRDYSVAIQKLEPYINVDAGTMSPYEHGECFVTNDGVETDLDLGHYERFLEIPTSQANYITTGSIYQHVIKKERDGEFLGKTVQVVPHITNAIKDRILELGKTNQYDFIISEVGGCVGDIESLPYIEAIRQLRFELEKNSFISIHLTLIPYLSAADELKTKPTQNSVKQLQSLGIQPDIIVCRTEKSLSKNIKQKISLFCNVSLDSVIEAIDVDTIYKVPICMKQEKLDTKILEIVGIKNSKENNLKKWEDFLQKYTSSSKKIKIALIGKYVDIPDAYKSICEALIHAGAHHSVGITIKMIQADSINSKNIKNILSEIHGVIIGPGYGERGIEGKIEAIKFARLNKIPLFGICLGFQCMIVEFARNILLWPEAKSLEVDPSTPYPVINMMENQKLIAQMGGTNRLGTQDCIINKNSISYNCYAKEKISERHRHRYEFNEKYKSDFIHAGLKIVGIHATSNLTEIVEIENHPWYVGVQFHPEYQSTPQNPHPLFLGFIDTIKKIFITSINFDMK